MAKPHRSEGVKRRLPASPAPIDFSAPPSIPPNPPKRRPWFLLAAAAAMALWLLFLLWMAVDASG